MDEMREIQKKFNDQYHGTDTNEGEQLFAQAEKPNEQEEE